MTDGFAYPTRRADRNLKQGNRTLETEAFEPRPRVCRDRERPAVEPAMPPAMRRRRRDAEGGRGRLQRTAPLDRALEIGSGSGIDPLWLTLLCPGFRRVRAVPVFGGASTSALTERSPQPPVQTG